MSAQSSTSPHFVTRYQEATLGKVSGGISEGTETFEIWVTRRGQFNR